MEHTVKRLTPYLRERIITLHTIDWQIMAGGSLLSVATWYWRRQWKTDTFTNSEYPAEMSHKVALYKGLHWRFAKIKKIGKYIHHDGNLQKLTCYP